MVDGSTLEEAEAGCGRLRGAALGLKAPAPVFFNMELILNGGCVDGRRGVRVAACN